MKRSEVEGVLNLCKIADAVKYNYHFVLDAEHGFNNGVMIDGKMRYWDDCIVRPEVMSAELAAEFADLINNWLKPKFEKIGLEFNPESFMDKFLAAQQPDEDVARKGVFRAANVGPDVPRQFAVPGRR